jgi:alpha-1,2-mannosyltransferase
LAKCLQFILNILPTSLLRQLPNLLLLHSTTTQEILLLPNNHDGMDDKPLLFAMLRSCLAVISCYSELSFLSSIHDMVSPTLAHWTAICSFTAAGNFHASQAYLPSSSVMILWRLSAANQLRGFDGYAIFWGLVSVLAVGWPFCAVLFVSTGLWALWKAYSAGSCLEGNNNNNKTNHSMLLRFRSMVHLLIRTAVHALIIQALVMMIDYYYYGRIVSPIWNIFVYNATAGGDELYGVEPLSYYVKNLLLNFNFVALLGIISLPIVLGRKLLASYFPRTLFRGDHYSPGASDGLKILMLIPMYIWMAIVFPRPHKEERFLFPIYPMLCFGASIALEEILVLSMQLLSLVHPKSKAPSPHKFKLLLGCVLLSPFAVVSISRAFALHHNYSAPLDLYRYFYYHHVSKDITPTRQNNKLTYICTAGEWYRFPSSFFLPPNTQLGFLKSSFAGQLPQPFTEFGSKKESLTIQEGAFNDVNKEEMDRYVDFKQCSYLVELVPSQDPSDEEETPECLQYMKSDPSGDWTQVASYEYLDAMSTESLHRIVYIPFRRKDKVMYNGYTLFSGGKNEN